LFRKGFLYRSNLGLETGGACQSERRVYGTPGPCLQTHGFIENRHVDSKPVVCSNVPEILKKCGAPCNAASPQNQLVPRLPQSEHQNERPVLQVARSRLRHALIASGESKTNRRAPQAELKTCSRPSRANQIDPHASSIYREHENRSKRPLQRRHDQYGHDQSRGRQLCHAGHERPLLVGEDRN
jgi:hypothetical protein